MIIEYMISDIDYKSQSWRKMLISDYSYKKMLSNAKMYTFIILLLWLCSRAVPVWIPIVCAVIMYSFAVYHFYHHWYCVGVVPLYARSVANPLLSAQHFIILLRHFPRRSSGRRRSWGWWLFRSWYSLSLRWYVLNAERWCALVVIGYTTAVVFAMQVIIIYWWCPLFISLH